MSKKENYHRTFSQILNSVNFIQEVNNDQGIDKAYIDEYTTNQQRLRDKKITELLTQYVDAYSYKNKSNKWYKAILLGLCATILVAFCIVFIVLILRFSWGDHNTSGGTVVELISVCITFLTLIVSILKIITKYVFPEKEEEYITRIVEIIQNNDLENKKENIRVKASKLEDGKEKNIEFERLI